MTKNDNRERARLLIETEFHFVENLLGYSHYIKVNAGEVFLEELSVEYINNVRARKIAVSYTKGEVYGKTRYTFTVYVIRLPYSNVKDFFSLDVFLQSSSLDIRTTMDDIFDEADAALILRKLSSALKEYASEIIEGDKWLDRYYPEKD